MGPWIPAVNAAGRAPLRSASALGPTLPLHLAGRPLALLAVGADALLAGARPAGHRPLRAGGLGLLAGSRIVTWEPERGFAWMASGER